jgi:hypothetical protein
MVTPKLPNLDRTGRRIQTPSYFSGLGASAIEHERLVREFPRSFISEKNISSFPGAVS